MISLLSLWMPIVLSAIVLFLASWLLHMILGHHRTDLRGLPHEDAVLDALRAAHIERGDYMAPHAASPSQMRTPEFRQRKRRGPTVLLTITRGGEPDLGKPLLQWFIYLLVVMLIAAYVASRTLALDAPYLAVFRVVGTVAFMALAMGQPQQSIWWQRNWRATVKHMLDGLVYALLAAGVFGWLWPRG